MRSTDLDNTRSVSIKANQGANTRGIDPLIEHYILKLNMIVIVIN